MVHHSYNTYHKGSHKPLTTAHLAHTMSLLRLNNVELEQKIESELASNPALEFIEERRCPICHTELPPHSNCPKCQKAKSDLSDEPIVFVVQPDQPSNGSVGKADDYFSDNEFYADTEDLPTYILRQISLEIEEHQRLIATHILTSIDEDGFLQIPLHEIATYHHVPIDEIQEVVDLIQRADPIGVGSSNSTAALKVQLRILGDNVPYPEATMRVIEEGMDLLSRRKYSELGRKLNIPKLQLKSIEDFIVNNLNPYPGRAHWGNVRHQSEPAPATFKKPDVIIRKQNDSPDSRLIIEILWPIRGILRVNPLFKQALKEAPEEKSEKWKKDIEQANLLVKCLGQRFHTIVRLMERLAVLQREFIFHGDLNILPITRAKIAEELDVHEATISRAVSGKSAQLPSGKIIPISRFFDRSLHIRTALKMIISEESSPLSDTKLVKELSSQGYKIARRTVAKYRAMEGILPAHMRFAH